MPALRTCPQCGAKLSGDGPSGKCPACLIGLAVEIGAGRTKVLDSAELAKGEVEPRTIRYFGDYELLEEIARGGMGVVHRARQVSLNRLVALKMILLGQWAKPALVQRFHTEAEAAARLDHPNIVPIYEIGQHDEQHYFSMKLIEGRTLARRTSSDESTNQAGAAAGLSKFDVRKCAFVLCKVARAVHYAHQRGILHRDLKPSNILIDNQGEPHVTDFGLAKLMESDAKLSQSDAILGTPSYMAPEQASGNFRELTTAADVYSLGAILYELLTGRPPFRADSALETLRKVCEEEPAPPRILNPKLDRDLETICLKCLSKDPRGRYGSAEMLADDLDRWRRREPILARPVGAVEKLWSWSRRKPAIAGLATALSIVFLVGVSGVVFEWRRAEKQRHLAETKTQLARTTQYAHAMNLALRAAEDGEWRQALHLIQDQRQPGAADVRGFEWRHLWRRCRGDYEFGLPRHNQIVGSLVFSSNAKRLATFAWDNTLKIWNLDSRETPLLTVTNASALGGFSADGERFVIGRRDGAIAQYQFATRTMSALLTNAGQLVAVAAGGNIIVTLDAQNLLNVWDLARQEVIFQVPGRVRARLDYGWHSGIVLSPEGNLLAVIEQRTNPLHSDPGIQLWEIGSRTESKFLEMKREIRSLQFSPDGKILAAGSGDGTILLWDTALFQSQTINAHGAPVTAMAFSPDGRILASGASDETIKLWDVATHFQKPRTFRGQVGAVWSLAFSPDGLLASGTRDSTVKVWVGKEENARNTVTNLYSREWGNFTFSPDSKLIAAGCKGQTVRVWAVETLEEKAVLPGAMFAVAFSGDGKSLLVSSLNEAPAWWDLETKTSRPLPSYNGKIEGKVPCVDISADRRTGALGFVNGNIQIVEIESGCVVATFHAHDGGVGSVAFSPSGDKLVSGGRDKSVAVWDVRTQTKLQSSPEHRGSVCAVAISPSGTILASGCNANTIKFWNAADMTKSVASMPYHKSVIRALCFAPDEKTLASGSEDNTVKLWSVKSHLEVASYKFSDHVRLVSFSPDGNHLAVVTDNGTLDLLHAVSLQHADLEAEAFGK